MERHGTSSCVENDLCFLVLALLQRKTALLHTEISKLSDLFGLESHTLGAGLVYVLVKT